MTLTELLARPEHSPYVGGFIADWIKEMMPPVQMIDYLMDIDEDHLAETVREIIGWGGEIRWGDKLRSSVDEDWTEQRRMVIFPFQGGSPRDEGDETDEEEGGLYWAWIAIPPSQDRRHGDEIPFGVRTLTEFPSEARPDTPPTAIVRRMLDRSMFTTNISTISFSTPERAIVILIEELDTQRRLDREAVEEERRRQAKAEAEAEAKTKERSFWRLRQKASRDGRAETAIKLAAENHQVSQAKIKANNRDRKTRRR